METKPPPDESILHAALRLIRDPRRGPWVGLAALALVLGVAWRLSPGEVEFVGDLRGVTVMVNGRTAKGPLATVWPARHVSVTIRREGCPDVVVQRDVSPLSRAVVKIDPVPPPVARPPRGTLWEAPGPGEAACVLVCDVDGDRFPDLVCAFSGPGRIEARSGKDGRLLWRRDTGGAGAPSVVAADLDGDCETDLAVTVGERIDVLEAATGRRVQSREEPGLGAALLVVDADGDGIADLVGSTHDELVAWRGTDLAPLWRRPGGGWKQFCRGTAPCFFASSGPGGRLAAIDARTGKSAWEVSGLGTLPPLALDVDRDGISDVVTSFEGGVLCALSGRDGSPLWRRPSGGFDPCAPAVAGDLDGDGRPEIVLAGRTEIRILEAATGGPAGPGAISCDCGSSAPLLVDLDGDGRAEILVAGTSGVAALRTDGHTVRTFEFGDVVEARPVLADFDGDGRLDLAASASGCGLCVFTAQSAPAAAAPLWAGSQVCDAAEAAALGREERVRVRVLDAWSAGWPGEVLAAAREGQSGWAAAQAVLAARALGDSEAVRRFAASARALGARRMDVTLADAAAATADSGLASVVASLERVAERSLLAAAPASDREAALARSAATQAFARCRAAGRWDRSVLVFAPACAWARSHPGASPADPWDAASAAADLAPPEAAPGATLSLARLARSAGKPAEAEALFEKTAAAVKRLAVAGDLEGALSAAREALDCAPPEGARRQLEGLVAELAKALR